MGAYNTLNISVRCNSCNCLYQSKLQFKFGAIRQYEYELGDVVIIEDTSLTDYNYVVYGILEDAICPHCGYANPDEYDILMIRGQIKGCSIIKDVSLYLGKNEGNYYEEL